MVTFALVSNLTTRWHHLSLARRTFCHHMMPKHSLQILATRWSYLHRLQSWPPVANWATEHWFKIWSSGSATNIGSKVGHQVGSHALPHCLEGIALLALLVCIDLVYQDTFSLKSQQGLGLTDIRTHRSDPRFT